MSLIYLKYKIKKDFKKENSDAVNIYLRLRIRKSRAKYLLRKKEKKKLLFIEIEKDPYDTVPPA